MSAVPPLRFKIRFVHWQRVCIVLGKQSRQVSKCMWWYWVLAKEEAKSLFGDLIVRCLRDSINGCNFSCRIFNVSQSYVNSACYIQIVRFTPFSFPCLLIPTQVTVPGSRPPTESLQQVRACNFLQQVVRERERTCCFFDGNKAWAGESKRLGIQYRQVSHQNHEYAKEVTTTARGLSNVGGTQNMDRWWLSLKHYIPSSLNRKHKKRRWCNLAWACVFRSVSMGMEKPCTFGKESKRGSRATVSTFCRLKKTWRTCGGWK